MDLVRDIVVNELTGHDIDVITSIGGLVTKLFGVVPHAMTCDEYTRGESESLNHLPEIRSS